MRPIQFVTTRFRFLRMVAPTVGWAQAVKLQFFIDWNHFIGRFVTPLAAREITLQPQTYATPVTVRMNSSDLSVFIQMFVLEHYHATTRIRDAKVIVDCGANTGFSALFFLKHFPQARVIAVEPDPVNASLCRKNLQAFQDRVVILEKAIWNRVTKLRFNEATRVPGEEWGIEVCEVSGDDASGTVEATDIPSIMAAAGIDRIDLLKIDIEKSETELFRVNSSYWLPAVANIAIELHGPQCSAVFEQAMKDFVYLEEQRGDVTLCLDIRPRRSGISADLSRAEHPSTPGTYSSKAQPMISVVMSVYNGERFLREAVESILHQSFRSFEFIIVDDGSTDSSPRILEEYARRDPRVRVLRQANRGLVESLNRGIREAQGKYIARMDADDVALPSRLEAQVEFMEHYPDVAVLGGAVEFIDAEGNSLRTSYYPTGDEEIQAALLHECPIQHPAVLMRREPVLAAGGYRRAVTDAEDYDLWMRLGERMRLANLPEVVLRYRLHGDQISLKKRRRQTLGFLAAQAAARSRRNGSPDPLNAVQEITPAVLADLGITEEAQQTTLARHYLGWIRNMAGIGEYTVALATASEMLNSSDWRLAEKWAVADVRLEAAKLYWKEKDYLRSIACASHAVLMRPMLLGRPFRPLLRPSSALNS